MARSPKGRRRRGGGERKTIAALHKCTFLFCPFRSKGRRAGKDVQKGKPRTDSNRRIEKDMEGKKAQIWMRSYQNPIRRRRRIGRPFFGFHEGNGIGRLNFFHPCLSSCSMEPRFDESKFGRFRNAKLICAHRRRLPAAAAETRRTSCPVSAEAAAPSRG